MKRLLCLAIALVTAACATSRPKPTPQPPPADIAFYEKACNDIWAQELGRPIDPPAVPGCVNRFTLLHQTSEQIREWVRTQPEWIALHSKPPVTARPGLVRANGSVLLDDKGARIFIGTTLFWALWGYQHDRERLIKNIEFAQAEGADYIRVLASVGGSVWTERIGNGNKEAMEGLTKLVYEKGMRIQWTLFGGVNIHDTKAKRQALVDDVAEFVNRHPEKVFLIEIGNELWANKIGPDEARALARRLQGKVRNLIAVTAPQTEACKDVVVKGRTRLGQVTWYGGGVGTIVTLHHSRDIDGEGGLWRPVRQPWRESAFKCDGVARAYANNEPIGPASSVNEDYDPLRLATQLAVSAVAHEGAFVFHTGAGIRGIVDKADDAKYHRVRPANLWETAGIKEIFAALRTTRDLLPPDLANWNTGSSKPAMFTVETFDNVMRVYCSESGNRFTCVPVLIEKPVKLVAKRAMRAQVFHPVTGASLQDVTLASGEALTLGPNPAAVIVRGEYR